MDVAEPNFIFEVVHSAERERKFEQLQGTRKTFHAYHGSRFDNFYSILHNGLNAHLNKVNFGYTWSAARTCRNQLLLGSKGVH